ncbi:MAG TPA: molybdenum cofactor biosynthesis protein MoaE [Actinomycetota bacterium]
MSDRPQIPQRPQGQPVQPTRVLARVQVGSISIDEIVAFVAEPSVGGTCIFVGTVRDHSDAGEVQGLEYEAWDDLAVRRLEEIAAEASATWPLRAVAIVHRTGSLHVGEASVVVAVSADHRAEAFDACRQAIERLKHDVPIWKKEGLVSGDAHWVMGS